MNEVLSDHHHLHKNTRRIKFKPGSEHKRGPSRDVNMAEINTPNERLPSSSREAIRNVDQKRIFSKNLNSNPYDDKILNRANLKNKIIASLTKYGLTKSNFSEVENIISQGLEEYLKNLIENLIKISRVRNLNLNLYSKMAEKNQVKRYINQALKIHTYNFERSINSTNSFDVVPYKDFSIIFTKNMKSIIEKVNNYEELSSSKNQFEKITNFKNKIEQAAEAKEKEKSTTTNAATATPKRENQFMKLCKKEFERTKQKEDKNRQTKESLNTLEYFLDKPKQRENSGNMRIDSEMASNVNGSQHNNNFNIESHSKLSDNISKSENFALENNELYLTVYKSHIPNENAKTNPDIRRRIILKDLIFFLENNLKTPTHNLILHKAVLKLNNSANQ